MVGYRHKKDCKCKLCFDVAWNKGLTKKEYPNLSGGNPRVNMTKKLKQKISIATTGIKKPSLEGNNNPSKRIEVRKKISDKLKGRIGTFKGKYHSSEAKEKIKQARAKQIFPIKDTKIEVKIQMFLKELGYEFFTHQYMKEIEHGYQCDILIPSMNLVIECDGVYWHKYPIGNNIDHIRTKELLEKGFKVLRLWEKEINVMNIIQFKGRLEKC